MAASDSTEYMLRLEIARLIKLQREAALAIFDTPWYRVMEASAESQVACIRACEDAAELLRNPREHPVVQKAVAFVSQLTGSTGAPANDTDDANHGRGRAARPARDSAESEDADVRSVTKIEMLERQLEELRAMIEAQAALAQAAALAPSTPAAARDATPAATPARVNAQPPVSAPMNHASNEGAQAENDGAARPRMTDILAEARSLTLRKTNATNASNAASSLAKRSVTGAPAGASLEHVLRNAMAARFGQVHGAASPASDAASEDDDSAFGSPESVRGGRRSAAAAVLNNRRQSRLSVGTHVVESSVRRQSALRRGGANDSAEADAQAARRAGCTTAPLPRATIPEEQQTPANAAVPRASRARRSVSFAVPLDTDAQASSQPASAPGNDVDDKENAAVMPPRPAIMLDAIKGFKKDALKHVDPQSPAPASVVRKPELLSPVRPGGIAVDATRVTLRKTGIVLRI